MSTSSEGHAPPPSLALPHRINRMPSVNELVGARSMQSPLTQLRVGVENRKEELNLPRARSSPANTSLASTSTAPPLPPIDFNLFRTASVYSVDSVSSMSTVTTDDDEMTPSLSGTPLALVRPDSPTTPKASQHQGKSDYFGGESYFHAQAQAGPSRGNSTPSGPSTPSLKPKMSFVVRSRQDHGQLPPVSPNHRSAPSTQVRSINRPRALSRPEPPTRSQSQIRAAPAHHQPDQEEDVPDYASVHGEQGSDWGDDEQQFEWVDTLNAPEETNGTSKIHGLSPSKRLSRLKAAVVPSGNNHDGRRLRKQLTFARRAPPPPIDKPSAPPPTAVVMEDEHATTPSSANTTRPTVQRGLSRSARYHAIPLRPSNAQPTVDERPHPERTVLSDASSFPAEGEYSQVPAPNPPVRKPPPPPMQLLPNMVPLKGDKTSPVKRGQSRNSQMSFQSVAYSLYDLDGLDGDLASPSPGEGHGDELALKGRYTKIKASALESDMDQRTRKLSERSTGSGSTKGAGNVKTPEENVAAGIEARGKGDLAKSAWYFMRATEGGSLTGKMYYGLALRHGWGIAKDENKAFNLLRQACDETIATTQGQHSSSVDIQQSKGAVKLSLAQKKEMTRDLSLGLFEIANCFLEGSGTKKSPEVAINYLKLAGNMGDLASQEREFLHFCLFLKSGIRDSGVDSAELGFLLSKGGSGVKKDMKEASRWYRMAISSGSSNTIGLAWVWKEKYMV